MFPFSNCVPFLLNQSKQLYLFFSSLKESPFGFFGRIYCTCFYLVDFGSYIYYLFSSTLVYFVVRDISNSEPLDLSFLTFITVIITGEY